MKQKWVLAIISGIFGLHVGGMATPAFAQGAIELDASTLELAEANLEQAEQALLGQISDTSPAAPKKPEAAPAVKKTPAKEARNLNDARFEKAKTPAKPVPKAVKQVRSKSTSKAAPSRVARSGPSNSAYRADYERKLAELNKKLARAQNSLMVSEMEVERLSSMIEERNRATLGGMKSRRIAHTPITSNVETVPATPRSYREPAPVNTLRTSQKSTTDMQIATVIVDKANLRTGPGLKNSPLMSVGKGTRLAVEHRVGEWYRVIAPTGTRAWVSTEVIAFGKKLKSAPTRTVKIQGYKNNNDEAAFQFIKDSAR